MAYQDFKDLTWRTAADKVLRDKAFNIVQLTKYGRYKSGLASMVYRFFLKKTSAGAVKNEIISNEELVEYLYHLIIRKYEKRNVYSSFIDNV